MMKKIIVLILALSCVLSMVACTDTPDAAEASIDAFVSAIADSAPASAKIEVSMQSELGTLSATYDVVYAEDGSAAVNYEREEFNPAGSSEIKNTVSGTVAVSKDGKISDSAALGASGSVVTMSLKLNKDKMDYTVDGKIGRAHV